MKTKGTIRLTAYACNDKPMNAPKEIHLIFSTNGEDALVEYDYYMGDKVKLWSEFSPELYTINAELSSIDGEHKSSRTVTFGMREFRVAPDRNHFAINGTVTFLRGEANCNVFPVTGYCSMDKANWIDFLQRFKSIGVNHMCFHTWCPPEAAFEAADELGMYLQPELYLFEGRGADPFVTYNSYSYMKEEGERILNAYANHPSFVMLSFGNETAVKDTRKIDLYNYFKLLDSTRLYTEGYMNSVAFNPSESFNEKFFEYLVKNSQ